MRLMKRRKRNRIWSMKDCIFCKIVAGEIPSEVVYEDENCLVFKDLYPKAKTHLLIIPKQHIETVMDMEQTHSPLFGDLMYCSKKVADLLGIKGYKLQINVGKDGGQEVFHVHIHLLAN